MGINLNDLDGLLGYDPATHSIAGMPTMGDHTHPLVAARAGMPPPAAPDIQTPGYSPEMASPSIPQLQPPNKQQSQSAGKNEFKLGMPHVTDQPETPGYYQQKESVNQYEQAHPWGSDVSAHPGMLGKIGHALGRIGNAAGDFAAPGLMLGIPGSDLNRRMQSQQNLAGEVATQKPELAELAGEQKGQLQAQRDEEADKRLKETLGSREGIATKGNATKEDIAGKEITSHEDIAGNQIASREKIAKTADETRKLIAQEHEAGATSRAGMAQDPNKLTNAMKTMKQTAQATLPEIDAALDETEKVKGMLGPVSGRWNDFWQGKVGAGDPAFAHYKDEVAFVSTAVTLAHARGRMSNELFEHFQQMFDAGKQDADNMKEALTVAKEWLTGYANMGEPGSTTAGGGAAASPAAGKVKTYNPATGKLE